MDAIIGSQLLGKYSDRIEKLGFGSLNWLLGTNPLRFSFVSGYGEDSVKEYSAIFTIRTASREFRKDTCLVDQMLMKVQACQGCSKMLHQKYR